MTATEDNSNGIELSEPQNNGAIDNHTKTDVEDVEANNTNQGPVDVLQNAMGAFGKWHFFVCAVVFLLKFPVAWHQMSIIFIAPNVEFECSDSTLAKCASTCPSHKFNRTIFTETIKTEWDLVCDRALLADWAQTTFMFGILVGNILFGSMADKHGRRNPLVAAVLLQLVAGVGAAFAPWFWLFAVLRFVLALATGGTMVTSFVLIMEITGVRWRELVSVLYQVPFNLGHLTLPVFAYFYRDWRKLQFALSIPSLILISYYWLVPESPRWLFTTGRVDESVTILEKAAKVNKLPTASIKKDLELHAKATNTKASNVSRGNAFDLIRTPNLRMKTICICFNWLVCGLAFFGVAQYIGQSGGNIFWNVAVSAFLELPGTFFCIYTMKAWGRKITLIASNTLAGICLVLIAFLPAYQVELASIGLVGMSISFPTVYLYAGELFPTVIRNVGIGAASMIARIGSMVAPFVITLKVINPAFPPIVLGIFPLIGAILVLRLPETCGQPLPATIEDAEEFGKKTKAQQ